MSENFEAGGMEEFHIRWQIKNFSFSTCKTGEAIESPPFVVDYLDETKWSLLVYPRGKEDEEYVDIYLLRAVDDCGSDKIPVIFTFELEAADSSRLERRTSPKSVFKRNIAWGFNPYIKRSVVFGDMKSILLPNDIFTIHCYLEKAPTEVDYIKEYIAETITKTAYMEFTWTIQNWSKIGASSRVYKDAHFIGKYNICVRMSVCKSDDSAKSLILKLKKLLPKLDVFLTCRISILDATGCETLPRIAHYNFSSGLYMISRNIYCSEEVKDSYLTNDTLRLRCILNMNTGKATCKITRKIRATTSDEEQEKDVKNDLSEEFFNMYLKDDFCDVKVRAGGKEVNCHKAILHARSSVMSDLLDQAECTPEGCVVLDIEDLDGDTLDEMVYFFYTDEIKKMKYDKALKLLDASQKFQIRYLTEKCLLYLSTVLDLGNVYDILAVAYLHKYGDLKTHAIKCISDHFPRICLTIEWENFSKTWKELADYTCREIRRLKNL